MTVTGNRNKSPEQRNFPDTAKGFELPSASTFDSLGGSATSSVRELGIASKPEDVLPKALRLWRWYMVAEAASKYRVVAPQRPCEPTRKGPYGWVENNRRIF